MAPARGARLPRRRLDAELVRRRLAPTRSQAQALIAAGRVTVAGAPAAKAATLVTPADPLTVAPASRAYASRGGHKLAGALEVLAVDPAGCSCLDAGASTGGFTDVLLQAGAERVVAVDVGYGQLAWHLRTNHRVVVLDRTNARHLAPGDLPPPEPSLVVGDLSFISMAVVLPALAAVAAAGAEFVLLVKPQFEVGPKRVGRAGVVRDPADWSTALSGVLAAGGAAGLGLVGACVSPLPGPAGNVEFFVHLTEAGSADAPTAIAEAVQAGLDLLADRPQALPAADAP